MRARERAGKGAYRFRGIILHASSGYGRTDGVVQSRRRRRGSVCMLPVHCRRDPSLRVHCPPRETMDDADTASTPANVRAAASRRSRLTRHRRRNSKWQPSHRTRRRSLWGNDQTPTRSNTNQMQSNRQQAQASRRARRVTTLPTPTRKTVQVSGLSRVLALCLVPCSFFVSCRALPCLVPCCFFVSADRARTLLLCYTATVVLWSPTSTSAFGRH